MACRQAEGGSAPTAPRARTAEIVHTLVEDWVARDDWEELLEELAVNTAPTPPSWRSWARPTRGRPVPRPGVAGLHEPGRCATDNPSAGRR